MSKTLMNLAAAFVGESQARNRYTMYAKVAKKEGYEQIAGVFAETAEQEREHASILFKLIQTLKQGDDDLKLEAGVPTVYGTTAENLAAAIAGEHHENTSMYPGFAQLADEEGLPQIATKLRMISRAEEHHEERYKALLEVVKAGHVFTKSEEIFWVCRECGYMHFGQAAPAQCPACDHPQAYYQVKAENY